MDWKGPELKIQYLSSGDGAEVVSCFGPVSRLRLPDTAGGLPIRGIRPYAFSSESSAAEHLPEGAEIHTASAKGTAVPESRFQFLGGRYLQEIGLPAGIRSIGEYAFYNCTRLARIRLSGGAVRVGNGAFMNCGDLAEIGFSASSGDQTCLFDLLAEIPGEIRVSFRCGAEHSVFLFPEYYEESVENGPARIFERKIVGVGYRYRQCFDGDRLKTAEYDRQFSICLPQMEPKTALRIALNRLKYPFNTREAARKQYLAYLAENAAAAALLAVRKDDPDGLSFLAGLGVLDRDSIGAAVEEAAHEGRAECLGVLLNERHLLFPDQEKTFDL